MHIFQSSFFRSSKKCSLYTNRGCFIVDSHTGTAMLPTAIPLPTSTKFQASGYVTENILDSVGKIWLPIIATWTCHTAMEGHFFFWYQLYFEYISILQQYGKCFQPSIEVWWRYPSWDSSVEEAEDENG